MNGGFIKLETGSYLNIDHIFSLEPILSGEDEGGTSIHMTDPTGGLMCYDTDMDIEDVMDLIRNERDDFKVTQKGSEWYWNGTSGTVGDLGL